MNNQTKDIQKICDDKGMNLGMSYLITSIIAIKDLIFVI
jgi:hypothetical protein